jgi:ABC-type transport system involved in cytochrome bd biosynthesis fused ATPase/permease subunit
VGCGKSSLLSAVLGEMERIGGEVTLTGSVAYVPQNPWIQSATVRENILFSHRYDEEFYNIVLDGRPDPFM